MKESSIFFDFKFVVITCSFYQSLLDFNKCFVMMNVLLDAFFFVEPVFFSVD